jgi:endonuclease YncB( thermonuclease family)
VPAGALIRRASAAACAFLAVVSPSPARADAAQLVGHPTVEAGDALRFGDLLVRLAGIEAPPTGAECSRAGASFDCARISATALMDLVAGTEVRCRQTGRLPAGDTVARCRAGGYDLSEGMAYTGWARAWPREDNVYRQHEDYARQHGHGLWRSGVAPPSDWQRQGR